MSFEEDAYAPGLFLRLARVRKARHGAVRMADTVACFQQLSTLIAAGTPLLSALQLCREEASSRRLSETLGEMIEEIERGSTLYDAARAFPSVFRPEWLQLIRVGELSGELASTLQKLARHAQKSNATRAKIKGALIYPALMLAVTVLGLFVILTVVIPTFADFFADFGTQLPAITEVTLAASRLARAHLFPIVAGAAAAVTGLWILCFHSLIWRRFLDRVLLCLPVLGDLAVQSTMETFASNLALLLRSGTPLLEAVEVCREILQNNHVYDEALAAAHERLAQGEPLSRALDDTALFTPMLVSMIRVGEEAGKLPDVLDLVAAYYQESVDLMLARLVVLVEPAVVLIVGGLVAFLLASIYLPLFSLSTLRPGR